MSKKSGVLDFTIGMIKKDIHFNGEKPLILQHDVDTDISLTYLSSFPIHFVVLITYLQKFGAFLRNL